MEPRRASVRPNFEETRKITLTMPKEYWEWFDKKAEQTVSQSRSTLIRELVGWEMSNKQKFFTTLENAHRGYALIAADVLGLSTEEIESFGKYMEAVFTQYGYREAEKIYQEFSAGTRKLGY